MLSTVPNKFLVLLLAGLVVWIPESPAVESGGGWEFTLRPSIWIPSVDANTAGGGGSADVDIPESDMIRELDGAFIINLEARKNRWGVLLQGFYLDASGTGPSPGAFLSQIDTAIQMSAVNLAAFVRVVEHERGWVDLFVGGRGIDVELDFKPTTDPDAADDISEDIVDAVADAARNVVGDQITGTVESGLEDVIEDAMEQVTDTSASTEWVDPYIGLRGRYLFNDWFFLIASGDIGGFGAGSDLLWEVFAGAGATLNDHLEIEAGWRYVSMDYNDDGVKFDAALSGGFIGLGITF